MFRNAPTTDGPTDKVIPMYPIFLDRATQTKVFQHFEYHFCYVSKIA